ncbi:MAG: DNA polymerase/3'-5' exonuclease PolX [Lewinellaceae bacterium]|nr:DNA polymerase/3'-5' exonuclease PolX [Lewinellaceae bacterium]
MSNKEIADQFELMAKLLELHEENTFRSKNYSLAYLSLKKVAIPFSDMDVNLLAALPHVGVQNAKKAISAAQVGVLEGLQSLLDKTPEGILDILKIKGLGPKKVGQIWRELNITNLGQLRYACEENRLVSLNGFGIRIQNDVKEKIDFIWANKGKFLYHQAVTLAHQLLEQLEANLPNFKWLLTGEIRRCVTEISSIQILTTCNEVIDAAETIDQLIFENNSFSYRHFPVEFIVTSDAQLAITLFKSTGSSLFLDTIDIPEKSFATEADIFTSLGLHFVPPEARDQVNASKYFDLNLPTPQLINDKDIKGIVHCHSTYSDGLDPLKNMAEYISSCGYKYMVITDHSKSATYANGLTEERVFEQWAEIEQLNEEHGDHFTIFKGIESDILSDGSLDYTDEILKRFDVVIASIHSGMDMNIEKATTRIIKAIENPHTRILGHPTGRLLLSRAGYPVHMSKIIDACAVNNVVIELNCNPQRLDIDWSFIQECIQKNVLIALNPDAHSKEAISNVQYGVIAARKGLLSAHQCLNNFSTLEFRNWIQSR